MSSCKPIIQSFDPLFQGDTYVNNITLTNKLTGLPFDITLDTLTLTLKSTVNSTILLYQEIKTVHTLPLEGKSSFEILPEDTVLLPVKEILLSIVWERSTGEVTTILYGKLPINGKL